MFPVLLELGPLKIHTYGLLIAIGFMAGIYVAKRLARAENLNEDDFVDLAFWGLLIGFAGARVLFVITRWDYFSENLLDIFKVWEGGLVFYGTVLAVVPFGIWFCRRRGISGWKTIDIGLPCVTIGHFFGRFGCLAAGCCYGKPTGSEYGIRFYSDLVDRDFQGIPLHPTQLYSAGSLLILFLGLIWVFKNKKFDGQVGLTYLIAYPIIRSILEVYRGDKIRGFVIEDVLSTSQFISILVAVIALIVLGMRLRQVKEK